jgi:hypothetical protein
MPYNRIERRVAALLDSLPGVRRLAKAGYQRANYLLRGRRGARWILHPQAAIERIPAAGGDVHADARECFYGYFGLSPWNGDGNEYLFHQWNGRRDDVDICLHQSRTAGSRVLATSRAWNFQQGSMTQWLIDGGTPSVVFNDFVDRHMVARIVGLDGRERRIARPIQAVHPQGTEALSLDYRRLSLVQPEYGYDIDAAPPSGEDGLWRVDLRTSASRLIVSRRDLLEHAARPDMRDARHAVNHAVYSPGGGRFVFMHRWLGSQGMYSRLYCAASDGSGLRLLLDHRLVSHYAWRDEDTLLVWARTPRHGDRYYLLDLTTGAAGACCADVLDRFGDGHPSFSPDRRWLVTDTYPDRARMRRLLLCRPVAKQIIELGAFHSPWRYDGPRRCDLHPRWHPLGRAISIDSAHEGVRRTYAIDVSRIVTSG